MSQACSDRAEVEHLSLAATVVERAAYSLVGHLSSSEVAHLILLAAELERISENLDHKPKLTIVS
jgi:hypothetical protein